MLVFCGDETLLSRVAVKEIKKPIDGNYVEVLRYGL